MGVRPTTMAFLGLAVGVSLSLAVRRLWFDTGWNLVVAKSIVTGVLFALVFYYDAARDYSSH